MNIKILVATHKEYPMPSDPLYLPIHVGKDLSHIDLPYTGDNTGDHISGKNQNYCELTALYYAWKNIDADYIGLAHYRRHFALRKPLFFRKDKSSYLLSYEDAKKMLATTDVLLPKKRNYLIETSYSHYVHSHPAEPLDKVKEIIALHYPEYAEAFHIAMNSTRSHRFNMFVMKKELLHHYCTWLFDILFQLEQTIDISSYDDYNKRVYGFIGERLLDVYLIKNNLAYKELPVLFLEQENWIKKGFFFFKRKFFPGRNV